MISNGFADLCVPYTSDHKVLVEIVKQLIKYGYRTVAIDQQVDFSDDKKLPKARDIFPAPEKLDVLDEFRSQIQVLSRLTIIYSSASIGHYMTNSQNLKKFHIVAGMPTTEQALQHCCQTFNGDLVCYDLNQIHLPFSRRYYKLAVERKMFFEICYAPAITDSAQRRHIIRRSHAYHSYGKSQNIIISSGADRQIELRSPYEVANLGLLFGLSEEQGKCALSQNCKKVLTRATGRRFNKAVMTVDVERKAAESADSEDSENDDFFMDTEGGEEDPEQPVKKKKVE